MSARNPSARNPSAKNPFWQHKSLFEMTHQEWESVCDGCAKCCLQQLEDEDTGQLVFTNVACDLLDDQSCRCTDYQNRSERVPSCMTMTPDNVVACAEFAPPSCAYRLLLEGESLPEWHPLVAGNQHVIHETGNSVQGQVVLMQDVNRENLEDYVVDWL